MSDDDPKSSRNPTGEPHLSPVPLTLEGWSILHQMFRIRWAEWNALAPATRQRAVEEAVSALKSMEHTAAGRSGLMSLLGHKGDLMLIHFRDSFDALNEAELALAQLKLAPFLEPTTSYLSVVELGLYSGSGQLYRSLGEKGIAPTPRSGTSRWRPISPRPARPWKASSGPTFPPDATSASIPWTRNGARRRTGTTHRSPNGSG